MKIYNNAELNEHVQWLIRFMQEYFPNGFEMTVSSSGAEINSINTVQVILDDKINKMVREENKKTKRTRTENGFKQHSERQLWKSVERMCKKDFGRKQKRSLKNHLPCTLQQTNTMILLV